MPLRNASTHPGDPKDFAWPEATALVLLQTASGSLYGVTVQHVRGDKRAKESSADMHLTVSPLTSESLGYEIEGLYEDLLNWDHGHPLTEREPVDVVQLGAMLSILAKMLRSLLGSEVTK